jgi:hypothetical protein
VGSALGGLVRAAAPRVPHPGRRSRRPPGPLPGASSTSTPSSIPRSGNSRWDSACAVS